MGRWNLLESESEIKEKFKNLKRENKGHYCSNYQSLNSGIEKELEYMEMYYMEDCDNLYVLKRYDHFYKLFYGLGGEFDFSNFPKSVKNGVVVCDIIEIEGKEKQAKAVESLKKAGFRDYKKYHMWECTGIKFKIPSFKNYEITDDKNLERLSHVYTIFDEYSDMLPVRRMFPDYIENRHTFSCFKKGRYEGSQIYHVEGNTATGEFVYAVDKGKGIGGVLLAKLLEKCFLDHKVKKIYVWIADDNAASIETHKSAGFTITGQYKTTLINAERN